MRFGIGKGIGRMSVRMRSGSKPAILLIHGFGCSKESFTGIFRSPLFKGHTLIAPDLPGFGDSAPPKNKHPTLLLHANACLALLNRLGIAKTHIVGHSMGGAVSLLLIRKIKSRALSFSSLEGNLIASDCTFSRAVAQYSAKGFKRAGFREFRLLTAKDKDKSTRTYWSKTFGKSDANTAYCSAKSLVKLSCSNKLLRMFLNLKIPKAYFYGQRNAGIEVLKCLKNRVRTRKIPASGHFMMLDNHESFYPQLYSFIESSEDSHIPAK